MLKVKLNILIMDKIKDKTTEQQFQKQKITLPIAPASFFAMTLGLAETGNAWKRHFFMEFTFLYWRSFRRFSRNFFFMVVIAVLQQMDSTSKTSCKRIQ